MKKSVFTFSTVVLVLLSLALTSLVVWTEAGALTEEALQWGQFIGRFHPVVLHLPIGLFVGLFVLEVVALRQRNERLALANTIIVSLMAISVVAAACLGLLLAANGDYSGDTHWWHKWLGIVFGAAVLLIAFLKMFTLRYAGRGMLAYRISLVGGLMLLTVVGHFGGSLTHGSDYLTAHAPAWLQEWLEASSDDVATKTDAESAEDDLYTLTVAPFFEQYCVQCHGPEKQKSGYRIDTHGYMMTPGKMGDTPVVPFEVSQSQLIEYLLLPESDEMAMPPEGKPRPSADEILAIAHWVALGAEGPPVDAAVLKAQQAEAEARSNALEQLTDLGILIMPQSVESDLLYVNLLNVKEPLSDADWAKLAQFKDEIEELNLAKTEISIANLNRFQAASQLKHLNLSGLSAADSAVEFINSLPALQHLNLFGSDLSDQGLQELSVPVAGVLYLGGTHVSAEQVAALQSKHPQLKIQGDVDVNEVLEIDLIGKTNTSEFYPKTK